MCHGPDPFCQQFDDFELSVALQSFGCLFEAHLILSYT